MLTSLPNLMTLSRIAIIPAIVALFFVGADWARWTALGLYTLAAATDWLDGYVARRQGQISAFGKFLDPIADKLLVAAILLLVVGSGEASALAVIPALIILCREILVSGLREFLAGMSVSMPVSRLAKWKTAVQMVALGFLVVGTAAPAWAHALAVGEVGLWIAAVLTLITGYDYVARGLRHVLSQDADSAA
ncbi:MAG: CDP-diacylglycerol--glycerol-3-phosphate 3-phosphatidyltransferase [Rhodovibrionaceae bacterium]|nr:CDP-diacylglycerol--glycerol-3-phosphate 3-phosphatidyltransferase [Rhodovibrionaceae bacterium]